jgi:hypothetical protein
MWGGGVPVSISNPKSTSRVSNIRLAQESRLDSSSTLSAKIPGVPCCGKIINPSITTINLGIPNEGRLISSIPQRV